ncbi:hypothetical protein SNE25_04080 [Mucilaginibacter sabulilitoris]|uniref:Uncharacterized protein n=1 Tax=Mucilaginibacter sabulilitoris TaxID=1173583 RepID=A0ABZ0TNG9_9SPHI|nr:hypothetical protein [Mucilaginibacter sabulilitoris]WPU94697.1 hypothetical protein SNE25_04080 [Mucilaginibacter sabulilitoris]
MKTKKSDRKLTIIEEGKQWQLHQLFGEFVQQLDRLPDARQVQSNALRSAPPERIVMVF